MNHEQLNRAIAEASGEARATALQQMLLAHASPVFGAAKTIEHEVAAYRALQRIGFISAEPDEYELVMTHRITKAKARNLLYQVALRNKQTPEENNAALRQLLSNPRVTKEGDNILIEVPDPLLMDTLRQRIRSLGHVSDGSFSGSVAKFPVKALSALIVDLIAEEVRTAIRKKLKAQGIQGDDLTGLIGSALGQLGKRVAGKVGERVAEQIGDKVADFLTDGVTAAFNWVKTHAEDDL